MADYRNHAGRCLLGGVLAGLTLVVPTVARSAPDGNSEAEFEVCLQDSSTAEVCSTKELSNIVVQCDNGDDTSYFFKYDDLDDPEGENAVYLGETAHTGVFPCPEGEDILAVFVKSGSKKYAGDELAGLPSGSGAAWTPQECPVDCPEPSLDDEEEEEEAEVGEESSE